MFRSAALIAAISVALPAFSQEGVENVITDHPVGPDVSEEAAERLMIIEAGTHTLEEFLWRSRLVVVFADSPFDPRFVQQMGFIEAGADDLHERDVIVITDTDPAANSPLREELRPRGFDMVLIGKDGFKYLRKPLPWDVREISRSIDKMPLRQQELRDLRGR